MSKVYYCPKCGKILSQDKSTCYHCKSDIVPKESLHDYEYYKRKSMMLVGNYSYANQILIDEEVFYTESFGTTVDEKLETIKHKKAQELKEKQRKDAISAIEWEISFFKKAGIACLLGGLFGIVLFFVFVIYIDNAFFSEILAFASIGVSIFCIWFLVHIPSGIRENKDKIQQIENDFETYQKAQNAVQQKQTDKMMRDIRAAHPKCPNCGGTNTKRISTVNRAASVATWGLASSKIGKQYECQSCRHKW